MLGALADMFSKTRLIAACMLVVGIATLACGLATSFEMLMILRVIAGIAAGGVFPIALAVAGDRVPVQQRQVAIGRLLFAAMSGNLLGASGAGVIGDVVGCSIRGSAVGIRCVASVTFRNAAPQLLQKPCPDWTGFPHW